MSPTPIRDPNLPGDPAELRDIPDHQMAPDWGGHAHNPVPPPPTPSNGPPPEAVPPPVLTSIDPIISYQPAELITAYGSGFTSTTVMQFDGKPQQTTVASPISLQATVTASPGAYDVWLSDTGGDSAKLKFQFVAKKAATHEAPAKKK